MITDVIDGYCPLPSLPTVRFVLSKVILGHATQSISHSYFVVGQNTVCFKSSNEVQ